jgi:hypothetical protein
MISPEKLVEMMNPVKAFEAMGTAKLFDATLPIKWFGDAAEQMFGVVDTYQAQTRKTLEFWMDQSEAAAKEGQKLLKEWTSALSKTSADLVTEVEANVKEAAKVFELPKTAKAAKAV